MSFFKKVFKKVGKALGFSPPKFKSPSLQDLPSVPTRADADIQAAANAQREEALKKRGRVSTLLTGGQGDTSLAPIGKRTLLG